MAQENMESAFRKIPFSKLKPKMITALAEEGERDVYNTGKISEFTYSNGGKVIKSVQFPVIDEAGTTRGTGGRRLHENIDGLLQN